MSKPNCYECVYVKNIPGNAHKRCTNRKAKAVGNLHGISNGWFFWPINFDPVWLIICDGFKQTEPTNDQATEGEDGR